MRSAPLLTLTALAAVAPALLGCAEQPAIEVRWGFVESVEARDEGATPELNGVFDCASSGVGQVQLRVFTEDNELFVGSKTHDCFPQSFSDDGKLARGPIIDTPGTYRLEVVGLRGNEVPFARRFEPSSLLGDVQPIPAPEAPPGYDCEVREDRAIRTRIVEVLVDPLDETKGTKLVEEREPIDYLYQYCVLAAWPPLDESVDNRFTVDEDGNVEWVDFDTFDEIPLVRPLECDDGIDNDGDGAVDGADLACQVSLANPETADEGFTVIRVLAGFFDSQFVSCTATNTTQMVARVKDDQGELVEAFESEGCILLDPTFQVGPLGRVLPPGDYFIEAEILGRPPNSQAIETVTVTKEAGPFVVPENAGGVFVTEFNFEPEDFFEPFEDRLQVSAAFPVTPAGQSRSCQHSDIFSIDSVDFQFSTDPEGNNVIFAGTAPCPEPQNPRLETEEPVSWASDKYYISAQAKSGGDTCYELVGRTVGPFPGENNAQFLTMTRLTNEDGSPVDGCRECTLQKHCDGLDNDDNDNPGPSNSGATCVNGYCVPPDSGS